LIVNWNDVVLHAGAFFGLTLVALALFAPVVRVCLVVFALGVGVEIVQLASAHHEPSLRDVLANGAGVVLAGGLFGAAVGVMRLAGGKRSERQVSKPS
jgi:VanZ family protein